MVLRSGSFVAALLQDDKVLQGGKWAGARFVVSHPVARKKATGWGTGGDGRVRCAKAFVVKTGRL
jgi:hypothetical protein